MIQAFKNLRVQTRIFIGFGALVVLAVGMALFGLAKLTTVDDEVDRLGLYSANLARALDANIEIEGARRAVLRFWALGEESALKEAADHRKAAEKLLQESHDKAIVEARKRAYAAGVAELKSLDQQTEQLGAVGLAMAADKKKLVAVGDDMIAAEAKLVDALRAAKAADKAQDLDLALTRMRVANWRSLALLDPAGPAKFQEAEQKVKTALAAAETVVGEAGVAPFKTALAGYSAAYNSMMANEAKRDQLYDKVIVPHIVAIQKSIADTTASLRKDSDAVVAATNALIDHTFNMQVTAAVIAAVLGALAALVIGRSIAKPVVHMTEVMGTLARGDNTVDVPSTDQRDEIGDMARAVEVFKRNAIENQRLQAEQEALKAQAAAQQKATLNQLADNFEQSVGNIVQMVASAANELQASAGSMTSTADQTSEQSIAVAAAANQASTNVQTVAVASEELASSISEISRQVAQSARMAAQAVEDARKTDETVQGLAMGAQRIGDVVQLIHNIASQTNLLALNATIEAARAGEAGKGFAVVAAEVKNLASQTAKATEEITAQISAIQASTDGAVKAIQQIGSSIAEMSEVSTAIAAAVEEQGAATAEITRNTHQAAQGTADVTSNITNVNRGAAETGAAANQVLSASGELSRHATTLRSEVDRFLHGVRAA